MIRTLFTHRVLIISAKLAVAVKASVHVPDGGDLPERLTAFLGLFGVDDITGADKAV